MHVEAPPRPQVAVISLNIPVTTPRKRSARHFAVPKGTGTDSVSGDEPQSPRDGPWALAHVVNWLSVDDSYSE